MHKAICAFTLTLVAMLSKRVMERKRYNWRCDRLGCSLIDGFDLVRHVRTGDRNERDSKIVMLTAYEGPDYIETARNVGCDVILPNRLISRTSKKSLPRFISNHPESLQDLHRFSEIRRIRSFITLGNAGQTRAALAALVWRGFACRCLQGKRAPFGDIGGQSRSYPVVF
jgi:CheY-like chemotaxis protein